METEIKEFTEKVLAQLYINKIRIILVFILSVVLVVLSQLPYFNLLLQTKFTIFIIIALIVIALRVPSGKIVLLAGLFLLGSFVMHLASQFDPAELLGNYVYGLFFLASIKAIFGK